MCYSSTIKKKAANNLPGKEITMMNTVLRIYFNSECYDALSQYQGFDCVRSFKIEERKNCVRIC